MKFSNNFPKPAMKPTRPPSPLLLLLLLLLFLLLTASRFVFQTSDLQRPDDDGPDSDPDLGPWLDRVLGVGCRVLGWWVLVWVMRVVCVLCAQWFLHIWRTQWKPWPV